MSDYFILGVVVTTLNDLLEVVIHALIIASLCLEVSADAMDDQNQVHFLILLMVFDLFPCSGLSSVGRAAPISRLNWSFELIRSLIEITVRSQ